jgi:hypothetical protein
MSGRLDHWLGSTTWRAARKWLTTGSRGWGAVALGAVIARAFTRPAPRLVATERLEVGESIQITQLPPPPTRRQARKARKSAW